MPASSEVGLIEELKILQWKYYFTRFLLSLYTTQYNYVVYYVMKLLDFFSAGNKLKIKFTRWLKFNEMIIKKYDGSMKKYGKDN